MAPDRKVLFTTAYREKRRGKKGDTYDYAGTYVKRSLFRHTGLRISSFGLRFIKQNIPQIEILEYPTWEEYVAKLKEGWDIVGFSFYLNEIDEIIQMAEYARTVGIRELWAGNYGTLTDGMEKCFDNTFIGYAEREIARALGKELDRIAHPPLIQWRGMPGGVKLHILGILFTTRGCNLDCKFCQTPSFCKKTTKISLESIEEVLQYYAGLGIKEIGIYEESFGIFPSHAREVVDLLDKYGFYWKCMTRADRLTKSLEDWSKRGFTGANIGIENFSQGILDAMGKREKVEEIIEVIERLHKMYKSVVGYYMIGFENESLDSIKEDVKRLARLKLDMTQICILTPLPKTPLWHEIKEKYGIFEKDWHRYDLHHLVWNHPSIAPEEMERLLGWSLKLVHPLTGFARTARKTIKNYNAGEGRILGGWRYMLGSVIKASSFDYFPDEVRLIRP